VDNKHFFVQSAADIESKFICSLTAGTADDKEVELSNNFNVC
jgi:hypothetical protein